MPSSKSHAYRFFRTSKTNQHICWQGFSQPTRNTSISPGRNAEKIKQQSMTRKPETATEKGHNGKTRTELRARSKQSDTGHRACSCLSSSRVGATHLLQVDARHGILGKRSCLTTLSHDTYMAAEGNVDESEEIDSRVDQPCFGASTTRASTAQGSQS